MEKNEHSRIPDSDVVVSPNNPDDPNDPVVTIDDPNDPATDAARRRNIEMEKDEQSRIPDPDGPDIVVSPDDPNDLVVTTDDPNTCASVTNTLKEIRADLEKAPVPVLPPAWRNNNIGTLKNELHGIADVVNTCANLNTFKERAVSSEVHFIERGNNIDLESSSAARPRNIGTLKNELPSMVNVVNTSANLNTFKERAGPSEAPVPVLPPAWRNNNIGTLKNELHGIADVVNTCANLNTFKERAVSSEAPFESESLSSKHEKRQPNDTKIVIKDLEKFLGAAYNLKDIHVPVLQCCIYKVPIELRKIKEKAYTPQLISIGPLHHGNNALVEMEKQKLIYISEFQKREGGDEKLIRFKNFIQDNVQLIRNYYKENSGLSNPEFVNMILRDAVFIFEFFLKNEQKKREFDYFLDTACVKAAIACDLQLLENQLPYILLQNLFEFLEFPDHDQFLKLSHLFFFDPKDGVFPKPKNEIQQYEIQHFTDLRRYFLLMDFLPRDQKQGEHVKDLPTATKLHGSGVKFKKGNEGGSSLEISCKSVPRTMQIPGFKGLEIQIPFTKTLELQIPRLEIDDRSECLYRNMMALELCHYPSKTHICNFILLMDYLINTEKDVDLFVEKEIIFSMLGDNATVAKMFNNLCLQITQSYSVYHNIGKKLKEHYGIPWNHTMATLNTVYFGDIWKGTATVAAVILIVLTSIQAVCSILPLLL